MFLLTLCYNIPNFNNQDNESFLIIVGKGDNAGNQPYLPGPTMLSTTLNHAVFFKCFGIKSNNFCFKIKGNN